MSDMIAPARPTTGATSEWSARRHRDGPGTSRTATTGTARHEQRNTTSSIALASSRYARLYTELGIGTTVWSHWLRDCLTGKYNDGIPKDSRGTLKGYEWLAERADRTAKIAKVKKLMPIAQELNCTLAQLSLAWSQNPQYRRWITARAGRPGAREHAGRSVS